MLFLEHFKDLHSVQFCLSLDTHFYLSLDIEDMSLVIEFISEYLKLFIQTSAKNALNANQASQWLYGQFCHFKMFAKYCT